MCYCKNPFVSKGGGPLRVLLFRSRRHVLDPFGFLDSGCESTIRDLSLVQTGKPEVVFVCDSSPGAESQRALPAARARIEVGDVDLVAVRDLMEISQDEDEIMEFLHFCVRLGTRVIAFDGLFDTAVLNWEEELRANGAVDPSVAEARERADAGVGAM